MICTLSSTALHIDVEVVRWVYNVGSERPSSTPRTDTQETLTHEASGFFSTIFAGFKGSSTPRRTPTPVPVVPKESINLLVSDSSNIVLTIFAANVDVRLSKKMTAELLRSTQKKPPSRLRYELIYVSTTVVDSWGVFSEFVFTFAQTGKDEYDSSVKAEEKAAYATGSVFQGLRADLEGFVASLRVNVTIDPSNRTGSARVFIVSVSCFHICVVGRFIPVGPLDGANNWYRWAYGHAVHSDSRTRIYRPGVRLSPFLCLN